MYIAGGVGVVRPSLDVDPALPSCAARKNQSVTGHTHMGVDPGAEPLLRSDGGSGGNGFKAIARNLTGPAAHHRAVPGTFCRTGSDQIAQVIVRFGEVEELGKANPGWIAVASAVIHSGDRSSTVEDAQAGEVGGRRGLA